MSIISKWSNKEWRYGHSFMVFIVYITHIAQGLVSFLIIRRYVRVGMERDIRTVVTLDSLKCVPALIWR